MPANIENLVSLSATGLAMTGNSLANLLTGNAGNDTLDGAEGADTLSGGLGNDIYYLDSIGDQASEAVNAGTDTVYTSVNYTLAADIDNMRLLAGAINGGGNALSNSIQGNEANNLISGAAGDDTLDGGSGNDTLIGGLGNDIYLIDALTDVVMENPGEGIDTIISSVKLTLGSQVENLVLTGIATNGGGNALANNMTGNALDNLLYGAEAADTLIGGGGNDTLNGGTGADNMSGGSGNDTYYLDDTGDRIIENTRQGTDTVISSLNYTLTVNLEYLILGSTATNGGGNALDNSIIGNAANNLLAGAAGSDTLDGGAGADTLIGGSGDDIYYRDNAGDGITENPGDGTDTIIASVNTTLSADVENLALAAGAMNGGGNALNNNILGNTASNLLAGADGDDSIDGGSGIDTMIGGTGNDTYYRDQVGDSVIENLDEGRDTVYSRVNYTLAANLETLILVLGATNGGGNSLDNSLTGNAANNLLYGANGDDTLDGSTGNDTLVGGAGNDTYQIDQVGDIITENSGEGSDTVFSSLNYTLSINLENLILTGSATIGFGNTLANRIIGDKNNDSLSGYAGNDILTGNDGNDTLDGGLGADTLSGGAGDDTYLRNEAGDLIIENTGEGIDAVISNINYTLAANFDNLYLATGATNGGGNEMDNLIAGNSVNNLLAGAAGNDTLDGGAGLDTMIGGTGNDVYRRDAAGDAIIENSGEGTDTVLTSINYTLGSNLENIVLMTGATNGGGNSLANVMTGNSANNLLAGADGNDTIDGGAGTDTMIGGFGNDTYHIDVIADQIVEDAGNGTDTVISQVSLALQANLENLVLAGSAITGTGNATANSIYGNELTNMLAGGSGDDTLFGEAGNDTLDGGAGTDVMAGGLGNDVYYRNEATDQITESAGEGTDTIITSLNYTLGENLESLTLATGATNGGGNVLNNLLIGNTANNLLAGAAGNDTLDGFSGADTMIGGTGNDTYHIDHTGDTIIENASEGTDAVISSINHTLGGNLEILTLAGAATNGGGNALDNLIIGNDANNVLAGAAGDDTLQGGQGADTLIGGTGNDTYYMDNTADKIIENTGDGSDTIFSSVSCTLADNTENLALVGAATNGGGNQSDNKLEGNALNNLLSGASGNDSLQGGFGNDTLIGGTAGRLHHPPPGFCAGD